MLQNMREGAGKWLVWIIIALLIITLSLWGISNYFLGGGDSSNPAAKVNGVVISQEDLSAAYARLRMQQPQAAAQLGSEANAKQTILTNLVTQYTLAQAAAKEGFVATDEMLDGIVTQLPAFQSNGQFSPAQYGMVLNRLMFTPQQFMTDLRNMVLINQVQSGIVSASFVLPGEVNDFSALKNEQRNIGYTIIPLQRFIAKTNVQDAEVQAYYQAHENDFKTAEEVAIEYIEVTPQALLSSMKPSATDLQNYYQDNISNYSTPARWHVAHILLSVPQNATPEQLQALQAKLSNIRAQIDKGAAFAAAAKANSQDILTANKGGELPWFTAGSLGGVFEQAVAKLKPGEISQPVQTQYGYELIKLLAVQPQKVQPYAQVATQVLAGYKNQQLQKVIANTSDDLANLTFENPNTLAPAAKQLGLTVMSTPLFTQAGLATGVTADKKVIVAAFSDDVLTQGNNSDVITLSDGSILVLRVKQHIAAAVKPLEQVRASIVQQLQRDEAIQLVNKFGDALTLQVSNDQTAKTVTQKNQLMWVNRNNVTRITKGINPEILTAAFKEFAPHKANTMAVKGFALQNGDYAIVGVSKVIPGKPDTNLSADQKALTAVMTQTNYQEYSAAQKDATKVKLYN
jgi:peptidyl-prolyl cis-trans isomerase D